jgi:hypothetical protein
MYIKAPVALWAQINGTKILMLTAVWFLKFKNLETTFHILPALCVLMVNEN